MKWPASVTLIRHGQSVYNALRTRKAQDPLYQSFQRAFSVDSDSVETRNLAVEVQKKYALNVSDYETPLTAEGMRQALSTGTGMKHAMPCPDVILCSPYVRTRTTLTELRIGWPELWAVRDVSEDRIREQEHGLALLYNDWRVFQTLHPEQKALRGLLGSYWYQYPQGESVSQVRDRARDVQSMLIREYAGMHVVLVTHHLTILSFRANIERLTPEKFTQLDEKEKPVNCGVTRYECSPGVGKDGKLILRYYNSRFF